MTPPFVLIAFACLYVGWWLGRKVCKAERRILYAIIRSLTEEQAETASFADRQREVSPWQ